MELKLLGLDSEFESVVSNVSKLFNIYLKDEGEEIKVLKLENESENHIEIYIGSENIIRYKNKNNLFRALGLYAQFISEGKKKYEYIEKPILNSLTTLIDVSRNAVYKVEEVKKLLVKLAFMGYNKCMLYTEDTYEIDEYEYFGYLRGRYSKSELKEIDDFAYSIGIELIPCIQTLGHLKQTLKWDYAEEIRDTENVLLVGNQKTYEFIECMIATLRSVFRSKNIHIGMDEAMDLGRGEYITKNGYKNHYDLMIEHLNKVCEIVKRYNFKPMMWDDMFFRAGAPNGDYYNVDSIITDEISNSIPKDLTLIYWDYYTSEEDKYEMFIEKRKKFNNKVMFAGGVWKWLGYAPTYSKTIHTTTLALKKCKEKAIGDIIATVWADEGAESPLDTVMMGLILFGEHFYHQEVSDEWLNRRCEFLTGLSVDDFMSLEEIDLIGNIKRPNNNQLNPSKYLIYQDILLGAFDKHIEGIELGSYYNELSDKYEHLSSKSIQYKDMFELFEAISSFLAIKGDLGVKIRKAYLEDNRNELRRIVEVKIPLLIERLEKFHEVFRINWYKRCKGHGFEVIDIRLGGIKQRANSTIYRLNQYLEGEISYIEELDDERLLYTKNIDLDSKQVSFVKYQHIATQNTLTW